MEQNINILQVGMTFTTPSFIKEGNYIVMVNGMLSMYNGNYALVTNESSTLLATKFKE